MLLYELLQGLNVALPSENREIHSVVSHSERVSPSDAFVCVKGLHTDGHSFAADAVKRGAGVIICEYIPDELHRAALSSGADIITVPDSRAALAFMMNNLYRRPADSFKLICVTGTNGKTTTTQLLKAIYDLELKKTGIIGTLSGALTTPDPEDLYRILRDMSDEGCEYVFMEASSHALALGKLSPLKPDYGIFTNLSPEHLDFHGTMEEYFRAKLSLFPACRKSIVNIDDKYGLRIANEAGVNVRTCSAVPGSNADYSARNIQLLSANGVSYDFVTTDRRFRLRSTIPGAFTVYNTLEAAACALDDGVDPDVIRGAIMSFRGVRGRLERVRLPSTDFSVYIDFAHTPDAMENILRTVREFTDKKGRLVVLFGCGGDRDALKRPLMGAVASRLADLVIVTSDNSRSEEPEEIIRQILKGIDKERPHLVIPDRKEAITYAVKNALPGDIILLCGKGHEDYEITKDGKRPFSERRVVEEALGTES